MSLDVTLTLPDAQGGLRDAILIREDGGIKEISRAEWDTRYPGREPMLLRYEDNGVVFTWNITHNLNKMAKEAGLYLKLWRPEEIGITKAHQLIDPLERGLALLQARPDFFKQFNPANGWGRYENLVQFVTKYLDACKRYPDADVSASC
jgi:hypothetical protein